MDFDSMFGKEEDGKIPQPPNNPFGDMGTAIPIPMNASDEDKERLLKQVRELNKKAMERVDISDLMNGFGNALSQAISTVLIAEEIAEHVAHRSEKGDRLNAGPEAGGREAEIIGVLQKDVALLRDKWQKVMFHVGTIKKCHEEK